MRKYLALAIFNCLAATSSFAQSPFDGKWATDRPTDPLTITEAQRKQSTQLEVSVEAGKASGTITIGGLGGTLYLFNDGKVTDNRIQFQMGPKDAERTWTIERVNENTVLLYRGPLSLVGRNVLDLISVLGTTRQPAPVNVAVPPPPTLISASGIVRDPSKALIPGVTVTAMNIDSGVVSTRITDATGQYNISGLVPGRYTMTAALTGFNAATADNLSIGLSDTPFQQDFTLEIRTASASPAAASCTTYGPYGTEWCVVLHRAK